MSVLRRRMVLVGQGQQPVLNVRPVEAAILYLLLLLRLLLLVVAIATTTVYCVLNVLL